MRPGVDVTGGTESHGRRRPAAAVGVVWLTVLAFGAVLLAVGATSVAAAGTATSPTLDGGADAATNGSSFCSFDRPEWREARTVAGVDIAPEDVCRPDNPYRVASFVKGTNNVPMDVRMKTGLDENAVVKRNDRDGDGDPDVIHVTVEVMGVNEDGSVSQQIAPGAKPPFWVFAPKTNGMVRPGSKAASAVRMPSPPIRVEQNDTVYLTVENTHYIPHTIHLHGVDHSFAVNGTGNDGVPQTSETPIMPGESRTYRIQPREPGTMFYHCHVVPDVHVKMGLNGLFLVEANESDNHVQTFNLGAGKVRHMDADTAANYTAEFDLQYQEVDAELHEVPTTSDDPAELAKRLNREYDPTTADPDYFLLNGKSFPNTLRESVIPVERDERYRLHVLNGGSKTLSLHTHGHKFTIEAYDGVELAERQEITRDVLTLSAAQRADLTLNTTNDGLHSYGPGAWIFHDHDEKAVTNDGISPGGTVSVIAYDDHRRPDGVPETSVNLSKFDAAYYAGEKPFWSDPRLRANGSGGGPDGEHHDEGGDGHGDEGGDGHGDEGGDGGHHGESDGGMDGGHGDDGMAMDGGHGGHGGMAMGGMMEMSMRPNGTVINGNADTLPEGCEAVQGTREVTVHAGGEYADPGEMFAYERDGLALPPCTRVEVTLVNHDEVRHQWMVHGLPGGTYPMGMFNVESDAGGTVTGTFITPPETDALSAHCSLPNHERMGMQFDLVVGSDAGADTEADAARTGGDTTRTTGSDGTAPEAAGGGDARQAVEAGTATGATGDGFGAAGALVAVLAGSVLAVLRRASGSGR